NSIDEARDVADVPDGLEFLVAAQFLNERDQIDGTGGIHQLDHAGVNATMRVEREIFRSQMLGGLVKGKVVEQDRAQNRALGFDIRRKTVGQTVFAGRQDTSADL